MIQRPRTAGRAMHRFISLGLRVATLALLPALPILTSAPASAQNVLATVNRVPITNFDVAQRIRIAQLTERRRLDSRSALQELIDDQVKLNEARKIGYRVTEEGVDQEFARLARRANQSVSQFSEGLRRAGLEPNALRDQLRANTAWSVLLRDQARRGSQVTSEDIDKAIAESKKKQNEIVDYELQSVVFVVGSGQSPGERERAANAARGRFTGCEGGLEGFRDLKDVAVRPPVIRSSETLGPELLKLLERTPVGKLTPPARTEQGIEMVAVCGKKTRDNSAQIRSEIAAELSEKKIRENSKAYLETLRKRVDIQYFR